MKWRLGAQSGFTLLELLLGCVLGALVTVAGIELVRVHVAVARRLQAQLVSVNGVGFALAIAARDVELAGSDPTRSGLDAISAAGRERLVLDADRDADGHADLHSAEHVTLAWSPSSGGRFVRWLGGQSMNIAALVRSGGLVLRYFDASGVEIVLAGGELTTEERARVRRVALALAVTERSGVVEALTSLRTAAALRLRLEER